MEMQEYKKEIGFYLACEEKSDWWGKVPVSFIRNDSSLWGLGLFCDIIVFKMGSVW